MSVVHIRRATLEDITVIAQHRASMFSDMGQLRAATVGDLVKLSEEYLRHAVPAGEYLGWLVFPQDKPETIIGGAGVQLRRTLPHPAPRENPVRIAYGRQGIVLNVYTEREWRRQGLARLLMEHVIDWAKAAGLDTLVLHASEEGRPLYERLGFVQTNEMRITVPPRSE